MDYTGAIREAWRVTQSRALLGLMALSVGSAVLFAFISLIIVALVGGLLVFVGAMGLAGSDSIAREQLARAVTDASSAVSAYATPGGVVAGVLAIVWVGLAIADVAAQAGFVGEADRAISGSDARFSRGMREGMARWWRSAGLIAIAAAPTLLVALAYSISLFVGVSAMGNAGDPAAALPVWMLSATALRPLVLLAQPASLLLAAIVVFAFRYAIVDDLELRPAFTSGWRLLKANVWGWLVAWIVMLGIGSVFAGLMSVLVVILVAAGVAALLAAGAAENLTVFVTGGMGLVAVIVVLLAIVQWPFYTFSAAYWSVVWRTMTGRDSRFERNAQG